MKRFVGVLVVFAVILLGVSAISVSDKAYAVDASGEAAYLIQIIDVPSGYQNSTDGCTIKGYLSSDSVNLQNVTYTAVKVDNASEAVTTDATTGEISINGSIVTADDIIEKDVELTVKSSMSSDPNKAKYVEITVKEWCAIVFAVKYTIGEQEYITYSSSVPCITSIDSSLPEVYLTGKVIKSGNGVVYGITVRGNKRTDTRSADSGLKSIYVYKDRQKIAEIKDIGSLFYNYDLFVSTSEKATYSIQVIDNVGNNLLKKVISNNNASYDEGFETAVANALEYLEENTEKFVLSLYDNLQTAYYAYWAVVQDTEATSEQKDEALAEARIFLNEYARVKTMYDKGEKEYNVVATNTEYLNGGEIYIENFTTAFTEVLYGEKATVNISLAEYSPNRVNKLAEMDKVGINKCESILCLTLQVSKNGEEIKSELTEPLQIKVPYSGYKSLAAVQTIANGEETIYTICEIREFKEYIVIYVPYSYGAVNLIVNGDSKNNLLWLITLLIIPVGGAVWLAVYYKKKKIKNRSNENE